MTIPSTIPFDFVDLGHRARTNHSDIVLLAEDIDTAGLIQPVVLVEKTPILVSEYEAEFSMTLDSAKPYLLTAGGRRMTALAYLETPFLYHARTSSPGFPGFVLREEAPLVDQLLHELRENLNRQDMDWRDLVKSLVRAFRLAEREASERGQSLSAKVFGATLGVPRMEMQNAVRIYDHFITNPEAYADAWTLNQALSIRLNSESLELSRLLVTRSAAQSPTLVSAPTAAVPNPANISPNPTAPHPSLLPGHSLLVTEGHEANVIPLTQMFLNTDGLAFMESQPPGFCNHIVTDPDYAISLSGINSAANNRPGLMAQGIRQATPEESLEELYRFIQLAFRAITPQGFLIFWYAIDHHEKLRTAALRAGFEVQSHPNIWLKQDFRGRSNGAPNHQFPKSTEFAMVCKKPGTILAQVQTTSCFTTDEHAVTKKLNHPFAKPFSLWKWLYKAISVPGQIVFDPFVGSGSAAIAAADLGLRPLGTELSEEIYHHLLINLQEHYRSALGPGVKFK